MEPILAVWIIDFLWIFGFFKCFYYSLGVDTGIATNETKPKLERRATLGRHRSMYPNTINHFANQSQNILKTVFLTLKRNCEKCCRVFGIIWSHFIDLSRCLSKFTRWEIIEKLSIRRRLLIFLIILGQDMHVKHYVDLSSWYEFLFAIICIDMNVILDPKILETASIASKWVNTEDLFIEIEIQRKGISWSHATWSLLIA